jgi:hypothetical protein
MFKCKIIAVNYVPKTAGNPHKTTSPLQEKPCTLLYVASPHAGTIPHSEALPLYDYGWYRVEDCIYIPATG